MIYLEFKVPFFKSCNFDYTKNIIQLWLALINRDIPLQDLSILTLPVAVAEVPVAEVPVA